MISASRMKKAGEGNRTLVTSLEGWSFTTKLHPHLLLLIDISVENMRFVKGKKGRM